MPNPSFTVLIFLAIVGGACGVIIGFIVRLVFVTPHRINLGLKEKHKELLRKSFYVLSARWGIWENFPPVNVGFPPVLEIVQKQIKNGRLKMRCGIHVLGEPQKNAHKILIIKYLYAGEEHEVTFNEDDEVDLP